MASESQATPGNPLGHFGREYCPFWAEETAMRTRRVSMDNVVEFWRMLTEQEKLALADSPESVKRFLAELAQKSESNIYVVPLSDIEAINTLPQKNCINTTPAAVVASWRKYASDLGYSGPVAWKVKEGFALQTHAPQAGPCYFNLDYMQKYAQEWNIKNDEPTKKSLVFWVPRLAYSYIAGCIRETEELLSDLREKYQLPSNHCISFGSIALLFALILAHFKRTGERVPEKHLYAVSDTCHMDGRHIIAGNFNKNGLMCNTESNTLSNEIGVFLLGVEELKQ